MVPCDDFIHSEFSQRQRNDTFSSNVHRDYMPVVSVRSILDWSKDQEKIAIWAEHRRIGDFYPAFAVSLDSMRLKTFFFYFKIYTFTYTYL